MHRHLRQSGDRLRLEPALVDDAKPPGFLRDQHAAIREEGERPGLLQALDDFDDAERMVVRAMRLRLRRAQSAGKNGGENLRPVHNPRMLNLLLALLAVPVIAFAQAHEAELMLYTSLVPEDLTALGAALERKHGVQLQSWRATSHKVLQRALTEARAGRHDADVAESN